MNWNSYERLSLLRSAFVVSCVVSQRANQASEPNQERTARWYAGILGMRGLLCVLLLALAPGGLLAQTLVKNLATGNNPRSLAVNPVTNKIYIANYSGNNVTVIDGATNATTTVATGTTPSAVAVNPLTNKIYVVNNGSNNVTVIDGATNATSTVPVATYPTAVAVNPVTNKIYIGFGNNIVTSVTVIDGETNATRTVATGHAPHALAVDVIHNKIYTANYYSASVTVIDGSKNTTQTVGVGQNPIAIVVNPVTNKIYVANSMSADVTVIDGATRATSAVSIPEYPGAIAVNSVTNTVYVATDKVVVIDGATNTTKLLTDPGANRPYAVAVNPVTNKIYVANRASSTVTVVDGGANGTSTFPAGTNPRAIAANPATNRTYVANYGSNNVTVTDGATNATATVTVGNSPRSVAVNPVTGKIYVANYGSNNITVIDGATNATTPVPVGTSPYAVAINPVTNKIYAANYGSNNVTVIDGTNNSSTTVAVGTSPYAVAVNPITNKIYVANYGSNNVTVIDGASNATTTVLAGTKPSAVAVNPKTNKIYVANNGSNSVTVINGATNATTTVLAGTKPTAVAVNPVTNQIYVANNGSSSVTVINGSTNTTTIVAAGTNPGSVAVNQTTNKVYVANSGSNDVTVIDGATNATTTIAAGSSPDSVEVNPVTNKVYVTNMNDNNVAVITPNVGQNIRLTETVSGVSDSQEIGGAIFSTSNASPSFTATVTSSFTPNAPPPTALYYQLDTAQGPWTMAMPTMEGRSNPAVYNFSLSNVPLGVHTAYVYATYGMEGTQANSENTGNSPEVSNLGAYVFAVLPVPTTTALTTDTNPQNAGSAVTLTAYVAANFGSDEPTGMLNFLDGTTLLKQSTLDGTGHAIYQTSALGAGKHNIVANYLGGGSYAASTSAVLQQVIAGPPASIAVYSGDRQSGVLNTAFANPLVVQVTDSNGNPVLNVTVTFSGSGLSFSDNGVANTDSSGRASITATPVNPGLLVVSATVGGVPTPATFNLTLQQTISFSPASPVTYGVSPITLAATTTSGLPATFRVISGRATVSGNTLTLNGAGEVVIEASQNGNGIWDAASPVNASLTVDPAVLTITAQNATKSYGRSATFAGTEFTTNGLLNSDHVTSVTLTSPGALPTAAVSGSPYAIVPSAALGSGLENYIITYKNGNLTVGKASASVSPSATSKNYGTSDPPFTGTLTGFVASDNVTATYTRAAGETVAGSPYAISATLSPASVLSNYNIAYNTANFTITKATASVTPTATSKTYGTSDPVLTGTLSGFVASDNVTATYARTAGETVAGSPYAISATLSPGSVLGNYDVNYGTAEFTITKATTASTLQTSAPAVMLMSNLVLAAKVTSATGTPTGQVNFMDGVTQLGSAVLDGTGTATVTISSLTAGIHSLTAVYGGDSNFIAFTSAPVDQTVQDFQLAVAGSTGATVLPGRVATYQLKITPTNGTTFPGAITLSLTGLPAGATHTITPDTIGAGSASQNITIQVQTPKLVAGLPRHGAGLPLYAVGLLLPMFGIVHLGRSGVDRKKRAALMLCLLLAVGILSMSGCGGGSGFLNQAPQTYNLQLNGTSGALQHSATLSLTIQ